MESINTGVEFYSNVKASEVEWVWYPYIPCGKITMLQGDPGEGKSTLIIHVAAILTKGGYLPDGQKIKKPEMVIYQCSEDGKGDTIKPRLEQAGADCNRVAFIKEDNDKLTLEDERIRNAIIQISAKMVVLDPIQAFIGHNGNMTNAVKMREILSKLSKVAAETNCAIVLVGHMNKSGGGNQLYRGLGSIDIAAAARSILMVSRDKEEPWKRYMFPVKSSLAPEGEPIGFELDKEKGFRWIGKCQINVEELLNVEKSTGKKDIAVEYLQKLLSAEDLPSTYIYEKMKEYGIAKRTVQEVLVREKAEEQFAEETEKKPEDAQKPIKKILYPEAWAYNFGESTNRTVFLQRVAYRGNWDILRPARTVEGMEIITREVLDDLLESAEKLIDKMRCANYA